MQPELPSLLQPDWEANSGLQAWHADMQRHTALTYRQESLVGGLAMQGTHSGDGIKYVDILPPGVADEKDAIVVMHNFAAGWGVRGAIRHEALLAALPEPRRLIAFPNAVAGSQVATYSYKERRAFAAGDFSPLSDRVLRVCEELGVRSIQTAGYSQGAATGGALLARAAHHGIGVRNSGLFDPPNVVDRTPLELVHDFVATGVESGFRAARGAHIPAINEANGTVLADRIIGRVKATRSYVHAHNRAIANGLAHRTFGRNADRFLRDFPDAHLLCMRAELSTVTPKEAFDKQVQYLSHHPGRVQAIEISGIGHEFAENPLSYALLAARALRNKKP